MLFLHGQRDFASVIKVWTLRWEIILNGWVQCYHRGPIRWKQEGQSERVKMWEEKQRSQRREDSKVLALKMEKGQQAKEIDLQSPERVRGEFSAQSLQEE